MPNEVLLDYDELVKALNEAIDKEAAEHGNKFVTDEKAPPIASQKSFDFDAMMQEFTSLVSDLMTANQSNGTKITAIVDKYLGKGKKVSDCTPDQCEHLDLILMDLRDLVK